MYRKSFSEALKRSSSVNWNMYISKRGMPEAAKGFSKYRCVVMPASSLGAMAIKNYYKPCSAEGLNSPDVFIQKYLSGVLRSGKKIIPTFELALSSDFPILTFTCVSSLEGGEITIVSELSFTGDLEFRKIGSNLSRFGTSSEMNALLTGFEQLKYELIRSFTLEVSTVTDTVSLRSSMLDSFSSTSIQIQYPNTIKATVAPKPIKSSIDGWEVEGALGFEISGRFTKDKHLNRMWPAIVPRSSRAQLGAANSVEGDIILAFAIAGSLA